MFPFFHFSNLLPCPNLLKLVQTCPKSPKIAQTCPNLSKLAQTCPNLPKIAQIYPFPFSLFYKKMWLKMVLAEVSLALVISPSQCTGACWEFALEPIALPFILSGVCSPSEANYCSNPFEIFTECSVDTFRAQSFTLQLPWW